MQENWERCKIWKECETSFSIGHSFVKESGRGEGEIAMILLFTLSRANFILVFFR